MKHFTFKLIIAFWKLIPFKKFLSAIVKLNKCIFKKLYCDLRYTGIMNVKFRNRSLKMYNPGFTTIENEIFWKGIEAGWEKISMEIWIKLAANSKVILDIGANSGVYSFVASAINPSAIVYSFEPVKRTIELFKKNLELNPNLNITLIEKAVSNKDGKAVFYDLNTPSQYSASLNYKMLSDYSNLISYEVETIALNSFFKYFNDRIDLIKIDVEMHEPEAIFGMMSILEKSRPAIIIEILNDDIGNRVEKLICNLDYLFFSINEVNEPKRVSKLSKSDFYNYLLCTQETAKFLGLIKETLIK